MTWGALLLMDVTCGARWKCSGSWEEVDSRHRRDVGVPVINRDKEHKK